MNFENLLIELGTEELPPKSLRKLAESFLANFTEELTKADLPFGTQRHVVWQLTSLNLPLHKLTKSLKNAAQQ